MCARHVTTLGEVENPLSGTMHSIDVYITSNYGNSNTGVFYKYIMLSLLPNKMYSEQLFKLVT